MIYPGGFMYSKSQRVPVEQDLIENFDKVIGVAKELGIKFRVTGGNFITHEFYCTPCDFNALLDLASEI